MEWETIILTGTTDSTGGASKSYFYSAERKRVASGSQNDRSSFFHDNCPECHVIRGKMMCGHASQSEINQFLMFAAEIEVLLDEGDDDDLYGTEGWRSRIGMES